MTLQPLETRRSGNARRRPHRDRCARARLTELPVRTLRFNSEEGLLRPAARSPAGYRLYDAGAAVRAELVRTLRELGVDLPTVRRVLDREVTVGDVARAHAAALDAQIAVLRLQRAVLHVARSATRPPRR